MIKECRFIKSNGLKCQSPAMRGSSFCYSHGRKRLYVAQPSREKKIEIPVLQNSGDFLTALNGIIQAIASGRVDTTRSGKLLYALQMAQQSVPNAALLQPQGRRPGAAANEPAAEPVGPVNAPPDRRTQEPVPSLRPGPGSVNLNPTRQKIHPSSNR